MTSMWALLGFGKTDTWSRHIGSEYDELRSGHISARELLLPLILGLLLLPAPARAATTKANSGMTLNLSVARTSPVDELPGTLTATLDAWESPRHHIGKLHLVLYLEQRTASDWERLTTPPLSQTFRNFPGHRLHRTLTVIEDAAPVDNLLRSGVQVRFNGGYFGICRGTSSGLEVLSGLAMPSPVPAPTPMPMPTPVPGPLPPPEYQVITLPNGSHQTVIAHELQARISDPATVAALGASIHATDTPGVYLITVPGDLLAAEAEIGRMPGVVWVTVLPVLAY